MIHVLVAVGKNIKNVAVDNYRAEYFLSKRSY